MSDKNAYSNGFVWASSKTCADEYGPRANIHELEEWISGVAAYIADNDFMSWKGKEACYSYPTLEEWLLARGLTSIRLEKCLVAAETAYNAPEWKRWPSFPIRRKSIRAGLQCS